LHTEYKVHSCLSERESLCAKKLQPFLLLHSPKQLAGLVFTTAVVRVSTDLPSEDELPGRIKLARMVSPIPCLTPCLTLSCFLSTVSERQEEQEKEVVEEKECSSSKSDWNEWNSEQASGKMLEEGPNHVTALQLSSSRQI